MTARARRTAAALAIGLLGALGATGAAGPAAASGTAPDTTTGRIAHVEGGDGVLQVLVDVPADVTTDLDDVSATVAGEQATATAEQASGTTTVRRTAVLVVDLSNSMSGERFDAARDAAESFLAGVPDDVYVGIVGFSSEVSTLVTPSLDRDAALAALQGATLSRGTRLYDGVAAGVEVAGTEGQRTVLVLSDGADTSDTPVSDAIDAVSGGDLTVDVVALDQEGATAPGLQELATAGGGQVIASDPAALEAAFDDEAEVLADQVLVTVELPAAVLASGVDEGDLSISIGADEGRVVAEAFSSFSLTGTGTGGSSALPALPAPSTGADGSPRWLGWAGSVVLGLGLVVALVLLVPRRAVAPTPADRVSDYTVATRPAGGTGTRGEGGDQALHQATEVAADLLQRNRGLEDKISKRLDGAGSQLRPAEWLLVHAGVFVAAGLLGLLLSRGNIIVGLLMMVLGFFGPWLYLGLRRSRRRKAFNGALPDTLQLMSGSLAAGLSLAQSVDTIVREGPQPIAGEFKRVLVEVRLGVSLEEALDGVAERFDSKDFEWVVMAIRIQRQVGGNLAELLDTVAATMREREYIRRQVAALAAEGKLSAYVLGGLPPAFLLYLLVSNRDYVSVLFTEPLGWALLAGGALLLSVGVFWMSRLIKVEI